MKIFFCDACNESIPQQDFTQHRITIEGGRLFCPRCAPKAHEKPGAAPMALVMMMILLVAALIGLGVWGWQHIDGLRTQLSSVETALTNTVNVAGSTATRLEAALVSLQNSEAAVTELKAAVTSLRESSQQRCGELDQRMAADADSLRKTLDERLTALDARLGGNLTALQAQTQAAREELAGQKAGLDGLRAALEVVRELAATKAQPAPATVATAEPTSDSAPERSAAEEREVNALLLKLSDADPGQRYTAVTELGRYNGAKVVSALEGMLKDSEEYLRVAVVQNLRRLSSRASLPLILQALRDRDPFVRSAAKAAFEELAGTRLEFDPEASPKDREAAVKQAEAWWESNKARVLGGA